MPDTSSDLTTAVKALAREQGAYLVGMASVDRFAGAPRGQHPTDMLPGAQSVFVIAHRLFQSVLESDRFDLESPLIPQDEVWDVQQTVSVCNHSTAICACK